jgi:hypothetical protein
MKNIFIGLLLIFLDFHLNLGNSKIGLLPDFIGYFILSSGLFDMAEESPLFLKVKPHATGMAIYSAILYFMDLVGFTAELGVFSYLLAILSTIVSLYISYHIVMGVKEMEENRNALFNAQSLKSTWTVLAVFSILSLLSLPIPALAIISILVTIVTAICFLVAFSRSKNLYYDFVA